jgi:hypothetical protein
MKILSGIISICLAFITAVSGQELKTKNVIIVTLDGYRWQELFEGADPVILNRDKHVTDPQVRQTFGGSSTIVRRQKLMPFFWDVIGKKGQLYGNRNYNNKVNCSNNYLLSYPGYNEMLVGFPSSSISGNRKIENPNYTVLEFLHKQDAFKDRVAAFATWDAFPYILREQKSNLHVNAGTTLATGSISEREKWMNENPEMIFGSRSDSYTYQYAFEYLKRARPRVMFLGFDETDSNAHGGRYDEYLKAANNIDKMISDLWQWIQSQPDYKDQTTLLITTDHGRGNGKNIWTNHRLFASGSRHIWFAVMGPDTPGFGEMKTNTKYYQKQLAKTIAAFAAVHYSNVKPVGEVIQTMIGVPLTVPQNQMLTEVPVETRKGN